MKFIILTLLITVSLIAADATKAAKSLGIYNNYTQALKDAKLNNKLMVFIVVWDPCKACDSLVSKTLTDERVQAKFKDSVVLILDYKAEMPQKFRVQMAPHIYYLNPMNEEILLESVGRVSAEDFLNKYQDTKDFL